VPKRVVIVPYKMGSASAKFLKEALIKAGIPCIRTVREGFKPKRNDYLIYYGGSQVHRGKFKDVMNLTRSLAMNKLSTFQRLFEHNISTVPWVTKPEDIPPDWQQIVARTTLTGHSGQGITIHNHGEDVPVVPLYTKYVKKTYECRIHVMNGVVIDGQIKKKRTDAEANTLIRNAHTGWVYCREGYTPDEAAKQLAIAAVAALGLDFGAVDLIYNKHYNQYYLLEVNTAPGLTGTTLTNYTQEILKWFHS